MLDAQGYVEVEAGEIGNDWREEPERGTTGEKLNKDGSRPLMARGAVKTAAREVMALGVFEATPMPKTKRGKVRDYTETAWRIQQPRNMAEFLAGVATFELPGIKPRKDRTQTPPCPACNERHARQIDETCLGCGTIIDTKTIEPVELTPEDVEQEVEERRAEQDAIARQASDHANNLSGITVGGRAGEREETNLPPRSIPDKLSRSSPVTTGTVESERTMATTAVGGLWDASPASDAVNVYVDCGEPTTNTYRCPPCIDEATRRNDDRWKR